MQNFEPLASLCTSAGRFESYLVGNPEDRFSRDEAHMLSRETVNNILERRGRTECLD